MIGSDLGAMIPLARKSIIYEWRRFAPAIFAVAFSGVLLLAQAALAVGIFATVAVYIERSDAELWVGFPGTPSIDQGRYISARTESLVRMHPQVARTEPFSWAGGVWRSRPGQGDIAVVLAGIDPRAAAVPARRGRVGWRTRGWRRRPRPSGSGW